jgi:SAM-dependent methyltransferase
MIIADTALPAATTSAKAPMWPLMIDADAPLPSAPIEGAGLQLTGLRCVRCHSSRLARMDCHLECLQCGARYPVVTNVPVMIAGAKIGNAPSPASAELAEQIRSQNYLPDHPSVVPAIQEIFSKAYEFGDIGVNAENNQFLNHLQRSGTQIAATAERPAPAATPVNVAGRIRYRWLLDYLPRRMQAGKTISSNVRLENVGPCTASSAVSPRVFISYHWYNDSGVEQMVDWLRTSLLVDLPPGRRLTQPMQVKAPKIPGRYQLEITLVHEGVAWLDSDSKTIPVEVTDTLPPSPTVDWEITQFSNADYQKDHFRAVELTRKRLERLGVDHPRILEVGGNTFAMIAALEGDLYNVDVDIRGLQMGNLLARHRGTGVKQVCAEAIALPFIDGFFDCVAIFASLHHMPDPAAVLRGMARVLQPGGFIAVMCEPVGLIYTGTQAEEFRAELVSGINEQSFSLDEYAGIFRTAGLDAEEVLVDGSSLKTFLTPCMPAADQRSPGPTSDTASGSTAG